MLQESQAGFFSSFLQAKSEQRPERLEFGETLCNLLDVTPKILQLCAAIF